MNVEALTSGMLVCSGPAALLQGRTLGRPIGMGGDKLGKTLPHCSLLARTRVQVDFADL